MNRVLDICLIYQILLVPIAISRIIELIGCRPLSCAGRRTLRSSAHGNLVVPFARSAAMHTRSFFVVGPKT